MPPPWSLEGPSHPEKEGRLINISLGYEILPLCMGPTKLYINVNQQTGAFVLPPKKNIHTLLGLFTAISFSMSRVYTIQTLGKELGKEQRTLCKAFTNKNFKYIPVHWDKLRPDQENQCLWLIIQLSNGDPMVCGYLTAHTILTALCVIMLLK